MRLRCSVYVTCSGKEKEEIVILEGHSFVPLVAERPSNINDDGDNNDLEFFLSYLIYPVVWLTVGVPL